MISEQIKDVPEDDVGGQVQELVYSSGVAEIKCIPQSDGKWSISVISK